MVNIRKVKQDDLERVKYICIQTADEKAKTDKSTGEIIANTYATYYVREEPETCFVLEDDGLVVGYIICSTDVRKFRKNFRKIDLENIKKINKFSAFQNRFIPLPYMILKRVYPAHLHINLLEDYQGKGYGTELMNTLILKLKEMGVGGVMLLASESNKGAVNFYKRNGFKILVTAIGGVAMGKKI
ncbi:MAG: GNAT family N-acetyltransferase [Clostridia bacterium]|nr:GNAT family N-acetyltransferase [Clostridia bacterium]